MEIIIFNSNEYTDSEIEIFKHFVDNKSHISVQSAIAHYHVKKYIAEKKKKDISEIKFAVNTHGKPYFTEDIHFSISHSGEYVAIAFNDDEIGIDIEKKKQINRKLLNKAASKTESINFNFENFDDEFLKMWTIKEAYFKYIGTGITDIKAVSVSDIEDNFNVDTKIADNFILSIVTRKI